MSKESDPFLCDLCKKKCAFAQLCKLKVIDIEKKSVKYI